MCKFVTMAVVILASLVALVPSTQAIAQERHMQLLAPNTGWFLGQGKLYWTDDNGAHWSDITPTMILPREKIADVYFKNTIEGWVLLSTDENEGPEARHELASTVNSGTKWTITPVEVPGPGMPKRAPFPGGGS